MGNKNSNPPQPSTQNIQVTPKTEGHTERVNVAGIVHGGVGNTYNAQDDKECVEKELLRLRCVLSVKEKEKQDRIESVNSLGSKINKLEEEVENLRKQTYDKREDIQNIERKIRKLMSDVKCKKHEIAELERNVIPGLKKQIEETQIRLKILKETVDDKANAIPGLENQVRDLIQNLTKYDTDVKAERESIAELYILVHKLGKDLSDRKNDQKKMAEKMQNIEAEQAKQTRQFEDDRREREELQGQIQNLHKVIEEKDKVIEEQDKVIEEKDKVIEEKDKVIEEQDKDIRQLKDARAAVEGKVQELQDAVQEKTTQNKHGREEGKKVAGDLKTGPAYQQAGDEADQHGASSDVEEMRTTATVRAADDSVPRQGVTQKDSNPRHVAAFLAACRDRNMAEVKRVLDLGQVDINCRGGRSRTPVMEAALGGYRDVVELLLTRGADVSLVDDDGNNTLLLACVKGDVETVKVILPQNGVDVNCTGGWKSWTPVMDAAWGGHRDVVKLLMKRGADVTLVDEDGYNTLHWACYSGDVGTVKLVLSRGLVDISARNNCGKTAADVARDEGHHQLVDLLVSRGAQ
ncbi:ankyrin repeat and KH domain-containing protein mask-like isoform X2 [Haliotis rubra]|uniref:ankyrin repeat and KH domain-containing protein mask-like isoform X2 n=1 Tax=Haliotis rubra TaxID=36100 RepID=UPI001EE58087|nr:ankyrin repeat and KH domain-containing protein mask-like isoform X2 [Haliotis rubra]